MRHEAITGVRSRFLTHCLLPIAYGLLVGCSVPHTLSRTIYEDPANFVRVENDPTVFPELPHTLHSHPASITADQMAKILAGFKVKEHRVRLHLMIAGEAAKEPVFRDQEIRLLATYLSEALASVGPSERVTFYLSQPQTSIKREITTGGIYMRDGQLHFILGNYRFPYGIPAYGMVYDRRYPTRPIAAKGFDLFFEPADVVIAQESTLWDQLLGRVRDEMVIDLQSLFRSRIMAGL